MEKAVLFEFQPTGIRMVIEKLMGGAFHKKVDDFFEVVRFDEDIFDNAEISEASRFEALRILKTYKSLCEAKGIMRIHAIASSIFHRAKNVKSFLTKSTNIWALMSIL